MTMKRILHCTLICMVLVTSGCDRLFSSDSSSSQNSNSQPSPQVERAKTDFSGAAEHVEKAVSKLDSPPNVTVKGAKEEINKAIQKLGKDADDVAQRCVDCSEDTKNKAVDIWNTLNDKSKSLGKDSQKLTELEEDIRTNLPQELSAAAGKLKGLGDVEIKGVEIPTPTSSPGKGGPSNGDTWWWVALISSAKIIAVLLVLVLLASALSYLWKRSWKTIELNVGRVVVAHLAASREAQPDYAPKLSSLSSAQAEISSRLTELDTEVRSLARLVRESFSTRRSDGNPSYSGFSYQSHMQNVAPKDEPEFPVSAVDYLGKMNRFANVVRPDFQNGILVNDPDGTGELVLIRDSRDDTQPLFVVPSLTQFQTKQDFYTYYQKYYDCARPSAGDVWIIGPAVVERVAGGWQLREKGMLEIR
jgi:hypothetical protein